MTSRHEYTYFAGKEEIGIQDRRLRSFIAINESTNEESDPKQLERAKRDHRFTVSLARA